MVIQNEIKKSTVYNDMDSIYTVPCPWQELVLICSARWHSWMILVLSVVLQSQCLIIGVITCIICIFSGGALFVVSTDVLGYYCLCSYGGLARILV